MPPCVPLARRTRTPGQAGTRGGWGGTPSAARLLDFRIVVRDFFVVFPVDYGHPAGESARSASSRFTDVADGAWEEYLLASSGPYLFSGGELHEKDSSGKCVRRVDRCGRACGGSLQPKEMRHFALCKGDTIVQIHGAGPFKVNWVNPSEVQPPDPPIAAAAKPKS